MAVVDISNTYQLTNVGAHIDATDVYNSNENLLDNAYFVGGGSQLGDGIFPINQRGQTSYSSSAVGWFDRWLNGYPQATATLTANGVKLSAAKWLFQPLRKEVYEGLEGKTVTASVMLADGTIYSGTNTFTANSNVHFVWVVAGGENLELRTSKYGSTPSFQLVNFSPDAGSEMTVAAFKLEKGTVSTLANDVRPDFGAELRKCKRYLRYVPLTRTPAVIGGNTAVVTLNGIEMASVPTPALISAGGARDAGGAQNITSATVTGFTYNTPTVQFALAGNLNYVIGYVYDTVVRLSCEL